MALAPSDPSDLIAQGVTIVGGGRLGTALAQALTAAHIPVKGPLSRGASTDGARIVLLCVPDREIAAASALIARGPIVGHSSGMGSLAWLAPHEAFSFHPLMSVISGRPARFQGAGCAVAGSTPRAVAVAESFGRVLGMRSVVIAEADRALYHAAASVASNYLVTLESAAESLAAKIGMTRELLAPLARASLENWEAGGTAALTGPIARGDEETVERQRAAIVERAPELLELWDALAARTRTIAGPGKAT